MKRYTMVYVIVSCISILAAYFFYAQKNSATPTHPTPSPLIFQIHKAHQALDLLPKNAQDIEAWTTQIIKDTQEVIDTIINTPTEKRSFENTFGHFDTQVNNFLHSVSDRLSFIVMVHPDSSMRQAAHKATVTLNSFLVDTVKSNEKLYTVLKEYADSKPTGLTHTEQYFIDTVLKDFQRSGFGLPSEKRELIKKLNKEITHLCMQFNGNIVSADDTITARREELSGLDESFIHNLPMNSDGQYIIGCDYPTYFTVMGYCSVEKTRKRLFHEFVNRAHPRNILILKNLITKRNELAHVLGFEHFTACDIDHTMVQSQQRVKDFIETLTPQAHAKARKEFQELTSELPESVHLTKNGKLKRWDQRFTLNAYKKKHFNIDDRLIAEYFPLEHALKQMLTIYEQFFSVHFESVSLTNLWNDSVLCLAVYDTKKNLLGCIFLDLFPRANKSSHAWSGDILPSALLKDGTQTPSVSFVNVNFPKPCDDKPSLLKYHDVVTLFHEFGHAMHRIMGRTPLAAFAGTRVKFDFVEMPSQMLENWMRDRTILRQMSKHYQTGHPIPEPLIDALIELEQCGSGLDILSQLWLARMSLEFFNKTPHDTMQDLVQSIYNDLFEHIEWYENDNIHLSFDHLNSYGAKYYGYLWTKIFAADLFEHIKKQGLLNPEIGQKYSSKILSWGGSKDPLHMVTDFLGREPNQEAFFRSMGL